MSGNNTPNNSSPAPFDMTAFAAAITTAFVQAQSQSQQSSPPATNPSGTAGPVPTSVLSGFTPPMSSPPPSILFKFPHVEPVILSAILFHEFRPADLWKLDPKHRNRPERRILSAGEVEYQSANSDIVPMQIYFSVLLAAYTQSGATATSVSELAIDFHSYTAHLLTFAAEYRWKAVLQYHTDY
ncbi:uncharacterized protein STEHIDRAFT_114488 [Stereum hirsutum FP-91666 SS1]|uniref:uncharacterized protein n=1 Tax=Stereum hirsutum (strain FP-91666) TaxID=721885 RepID=UPI0004449F19|nr:uncharacterized protein STEHIDRAFT_114488 [Stereum hirsutum FP-91666 SS1]EIM82608.1 hypothetical protein STEHIDRAFT_114488 [Stereum hirsutum FP-91666 SS1]